jgi:chromosome segregation ATPase
MQSRGAESQELYAQLSQAKQQIEGLTGRAAGLEQELANARSRPAAPSGPDPQQQEEMRQVRQQLQMLQQQLAQAQQAAQQSQAQLQAVQASSGNSGGAGVRAGLPEEIEPLRWTLTAAIEALTALEQREPSLAAHLRNLRLLSSTLQKLSPNG